MRGWKRENCVAYRNRRGRVDEHGTHSALFVGKLLNLPPASPDTSSVASEPPHGLVVIVHVTQYHKHHPIIERVIMTSHNERTKLNCVLTTQRTAQRPV